MEEWKGEEIERRIEMGGWMDGWGDGCVMGWREKGKDELLAG